MRGCRTVLGRYGPKCDGPGASTQASRYVSADLVHFVGRSAPSDDEAFHRLVTIIKGGWLLSPAARGIGDFSEESEQLSLTTAESLSSNDRYVPSMVCFADIPRRALAIHVGKYRRFGLAFNKRYLIAKGVRPVYYVPTTARTQPLAKYDSVTEDWDEIAHIVGLEIDPRFGGTTRTGEDGDPEVGANPAERISDWLAGEVFAFVKFFDPSLAPDDPDNFYMEREWRTVRNVQFGLEDIACAYVAPGYADLLRRDAPGLRMIETID